MEKRSTILITGINGFLGSSIAKKLSIRHNIIGLELPNSNDKRVKGFNFKTYYSTNPLDIIFKDQSIDYIIHTATLFGRNNNTVSDIFAANLQFPVKLTGMAIRYAIKTFINTHTSLPRNTSSYSLSKSQFLDRLLVFQNKMQIINVSPEHFYGPGAGDSNFITDIIKKMLANVPSIDLTPGEQQRDFIYIDDLVEAYCLVVKNIETLPLYSDFEIGTGENIAIEKVVLMIKQLTQSKTILNFGSLPYRGNELMQSKCNNSRIYALGWKPLVRFEIGVQNILKQLKE